MRIKPLQLAGRAALVAAFAFPLCGAGEAHAQSIACSSLPRPVYIVGSSAVESFIKLMAQALANNTNDAGDPDPISIIYSKPGSCVGQQFIFSGDNYDGQKPYFYWDSTGSGSWVNCSYDSSTSDAKPIDIGVSDVFPSTCQHTVPSGMKDFHGPVQSMTFAVSSASSNQVISAEAGYLTLGFGENGGTPWNQKSRILVRDHFSGTQSMIAATIGIPAAQPNSVGTSPPGGGNDIIAALEAAASDQSVADSTIGILGMDAIRGVAAHDVVPLAYQHYDQTTGYYPSSSVTSYDMQNTRDGHYMIQGPVHLITNVKSNGDPDLPEAKIVIDYMTGAAVPTDFDLVQLEAKVSIVPDCAMHVTRDEEAGAFMSYMPELSCECKFLHEAFLNDGSTQVPSECKTCSSNSDCNSGRPHCNYGYCEVQ